MRVALQLGMGVVPNTHRASGHGIVRVRLPVTDGERLCRKLFIQLEKEQFTTVCQPRQSSDLL